MCCCARSRSRAGLVGRPTPASAQRVTDDDLGVRRHHCREVEPGVDPADDAQSGDLGHGSPFEAAMVPTPGALDPWALARSHDIDR
jgi:hypothetical protein